MTFVFLQSNKFCKSPFITFRVSYSYHLCERIFSCLDKRGEFLTTHFELLLIINDLLVLSDFIYFKLFECLMNQSIDCSFIYQLQTRNADPWVICKLILFFIYLWDLDVWLSFAKLIMAAIMSPLHVEPVWPSICCFLYTISYLTK